MGKLTVSDLLTIALMVMDKPTKRAYFRLVAHCKQKGKTPDQLVKDLGERLEQRWSEMKKEKREKMRQVQTA